MSQLDGTGEMHKGIDCDLDDRMLIGIESLAWCLDTSARTIRRWSERGEMPPPIKIGSLVRWDVTKVRQWISDGCPDWNGGEDAG